MNAATRARIAFLVAIAGAASACAHDLRFREYRVRLTMTCTLILIRDTRADVCLASYRCLCGPSSSLVVVPPEVCRP